MIPRRPWTLGSGGYLAIGPEVGGAPTGASGSLAVGAGDADLSPLGIVAFQRQVFR